MQYKASDHTFCLCAYGESRYLEECIRSLIRQTLKTNIIITTSTPNTYIFDLAKKYDIPVIVNQSDEKSDIAKDWNFSIKSAETPVVTLAHQDDIYKHNYAAEILKRINQAKRPLIAFSDYSELRGGYEVKNNRLLKIKRVMLFLLRGRIFESSMFIRRRILSFGSPICCPSVTYIRDNLSEPIFETKYRSDVDWQAWEKISRLKGDFVFVPKILMSHRIHEESATTAIIKDNDRTREDMEMFRKFWPKYVAKVLEHFYRKGEDSNTL